MFTADGRAFGEEYSAEDIADFRTLIEPDRFLVACDPADGTIVGITGDFPFDVTLPGGDRCARPGRLLGVRRRDTPAARCCCVRCWPSNAVGFVEAGAAVSLLTASEGGIYGRFGYGVATRHRWVEITRRRGRPPGRRARPGWGSDRRPRRGPQGGCRDPPTVAAATPGAVSRSDAWWDELIRDREQHRHGASVLFHLLHPDGYASYRIRRGEQDRMRGA